MTKKDKKDNNIIDIIWVILLSILLTVVLFFVIWLTIWFVIFIILILLIIFFIKKLLLLEYFVLSKWVFWIISILFITLFITFFIVWQPKEKLWSGVSNNNLESNDICNALNLKENISPEASLKIADKNDIFKDETKDTYKISELENLSYGYGIKETKDWFYVVIELCKWDESISKDELNKDMFHIADDEFWPSTVWNYVNFTNIQFLDTLSTGEYTVYLYKSENWKSWKTVKKLNFYIN